MLRLLTLFALVSTSAALSAKEHVALLGTYTGAESRGIYVVRLNAETGDTLPEKISNRVPVQPPPRKAFHSFDAVLNPGRGQSPLSQRTSARTLQETALGSLVPPPARSASS